MNFSKKILTWYHEHKRELPWRKTKDPYNIWLSEIILQQTRVAQGLPYYEKFIERYPTVFDMAKASEEQILKLWQGLGYYSRARNMHKTAKMVVSEYGGIFPDSYKGLIKLKGVGDYTASAIASICYGEKQPVVDGNVYRVLSRYFGVDLPINSTEGVKYFKALAHEVMADENVRDYNQGIMEFGAIQCTPKKPYCLLCPLKDGCIAFAENRIQELPVKLKKNKIKERIFNYLIFRDTNKNVVLQRRKGKGIWQGLYQFPLIETNALVNSEPELLDLVRNAFPEVKTTKITKLNEDPIVHKLSHQHLKTSFWILDVGSSLKGAVPWSNIDEYPVPVLIAEAIKSLKNDYF